ncbi:trypsin-7-like [Phymastichus coffea]|uniref:trypsin-7-like n=1 Tax=Phymastichus coffea TaxID=108790 RepID=UPI00273B18A2|nr:trypsin-7-like [Phymastichus coffea]
MSRVFLAFVALCVFACHGARLKIVNGQLADIKDFPYMVSLQYNGTFFGHDYDHFCCGSIISNEWIITSAQCANAFDTEKFHVRAGSSKYYEDGVVYKVAKTFLHPKFNQLSYDYDVGLLKVSSTVKLALHLQITSIWLLGPISDLLHGSQIEKISRERCKYAYGSNRLTDNMFCAFTEGFGPCVGDSGSGAILDDQIIGVTSWTYGCAYENPTVYAKVSSALEWIIGTMSHDNEESYQMVF